MLLDRRWQRHLITRKSLLHFVPPVDRHIMLTRWPDSKHDWIRKPRSAREILMIAPPIICVCFLDYPSRGGRSGPRRPQGRGSEAISSTAGGGRLRRKHQWSSTCKAKPSYGQNVQTGDLVQAMSTEAPIVGWGDLPGHQNVRLEPLLVRQRLERPRVHEEASDDNLSASEAFGHQLHEEPRLPRVQCGSTAHLCL